MQNVEGEPTPEERLRRIHHYADESLIYLASAYWKEKDLDPAHSETTVQGMYPYAHVLALLKAEDQTLREVMATRKELVLQYLEDARTGRIDWAPGTGGIDRR